MADIFRKPDPENSLFNAAQQMMPNAVPTSFEQWKANPENLIKIGQQPEQQPQAPAQSELPQSPMPSYPTAAPKVNQEFSGNTAYGDPADATPAPVPHSAPSIMPNRPELPQLSRGQNIGMALSTIADSIGAALTHTPATVGPNRLNTISDIQAKQRDYDQNAPQLAYKVKQEQTRDTLGNEASKAGTGKVIQETKNLATMLSPIEQRKAQLMQHLEEKAAQGLYTPDALVNYGMRIAGDQKIPVTQEELTARFAGAKPLGPKYQIQQDKNGKPEFATDKAGNRLFPNGAGSFDDPELNQQWQAITKAHQQSIGEEMDKETRKANISADAQARAFAQQNAMLGKKASTDRYNTALDADERLSRMQSNYESGVKGDQQAQLALLADHLGMTFGMQKGAKLNRGLIEEAQQSAPWLQKIGARFDDRGILSGVALTPEQMKQMLDLGVGARQRAWDSARQADTLNGVAPPPGVNKVAPGGDTSPRATHKFNAQTGKIEELK